MISQHVVCSFSRVARPENVFLVVVDSHNNKVKSRSRLFYKSPYA